MFEVEWRPEAEEELTAIWLAANSAARRKLTRITGELDADWEANPLAVGESRFGMTRVVIAPPLTVYFHVNNPAKLVKVIHVLSPGRTG